MLVAANPHAVGPALRSVRVESETLRARQQPREHDARLESCERCSDTVVNAAPEAEVQVTVAAVEHDLVGMLEHGTVPIRRGPEQQDERSRGDLDPAELDRARCDARVVPEGGLEPKDLLDEARDPLRLGAQLTLEARVAAFKASYANFAAYGVAPITSTGPFASQNRLTVLDAQRILSDSAFGIVVDPLTSTSHSHIGDIDIGGKFSVYDSFGGATGARMSPHGLNFRTAVGGIFRLPTGKIESPNNFIDVGTGRGAKAVEGRWFSDVLIGPRFWQSFVLRYNKPFADDQEMRITDLPNDAFPPLYRRQMVRRQLGATLEFETTPRIVINDFFSISGQYVYRHKAQDHYTGTFTVPAAITGFGDITLDASTLDLETEMWEHRAGGGASFSNLYSFEHGQARVPFEVTYLHWQTVRGAGGNQPKFFTDQIQLRLYARLFGN